MPKAKYSTKYNHSYALVIGIDEYQSPMRSLETAVRGAEALESVLVEEYGFEVTLLRNHEATRDGIVAAFNHYRNTSLDDRLLIYFAGHGTTQADYQENKSGLLVPYGVGRREYHRALEMDYLLNLSRYVPAKHILFVIDSCFSGMAISRADDLDDPVYEDLITRRGVLAIAAGMEDQEVADRGPDGHSPFTGLLLERLTRHQGFLTGIRLGVYLQDNVPKRTRHQQTPHFGRHSGQGGDFIFVMPQVQTIWGELSADLAFLDDPNAVVRLLALERVPAYLDDPAYADTVRDALNVILEEETDEGVRSRVEDVLQATPLSQYSIKEKTEVEQKVSEEFRKAGFAWLIVVKDSLGNRNQNSWAKNTNGDWSHPKVTKINVGQKITLWAEAASEMSHKDIEYRFSVQRSGKSLEVRQDWSKKSSWTWDVKRADIGMRVVVSISIRKEREYYPYRDKDDYTYAVYDVFPGETQQAVIIPQQETKTPTSIISDILPQPFEWCEIPAGRVTLEDYAGTFDVKPFLMAKYPITYEQFQVFIDADGGFYNDEWWQGLEERESKPGIQFFTHAKNLPRENVSWYDAVAFCRWLSSKVSGLNPDRLRYEVRLPTEWEWQWAAQGPDGWAYPWGNDYIKGYANIDEKASMIKGGTYLKKTTSVGSYPKGASLYGVLDMSGNVVEWCLNEYEDPGQVDTTGDAFRVSRGGSWSGYGNWARAAYRSWYDPRRRLSYLGFRVVGLLLAS